jgi:hypothetical protein
MLGICRHRSTGNFADLLVIQAVEVGAESSLWKLQYAWMRVDTFPAAAILEVHDLLRSRNRGDSLKRTASEYHS